MGKPKKSDGASKPFALSKDAINRVNLGQAFAEYDPVLAKEGVFVRTPALVAAQDASRAKCFFVGRRGTGKTAITFYLGSKSRNVIQIHPELFATLGTVLDVEDVRDVKQQPFHSLVAIFRRAMLDEVLSEWVRRHLTDYGKFPDKLRSERNWLENYDFDTRVLALVEESEAARKKNDDKAWLKSRGRAKEIAVMMNEMREGPAWDLILLIDRIDDTWNGSDLAVVLLMAMMHACVELAASSTIVHPLLFLRENLFQRVGQIDAEFARLETAVVSLDWTKELLVEMIERRLQAAVNPKPPLGQTWDLFFEQIDGKTSSEQVLGFCQNRPRDVLLFSSMAVAEAQSHKHTKVTADDLGVARRKFSINRLKEVGDEYSENFPRIALVLQRFHGLGNIFTYAAITEFIEKLLVDPEILKYCKAWINDQSAPHRFIALLYNIGFFGIVNGGKEEFRSHEATSEVPNIQAQTQVIIHPSYADALNLQAAVITTLAGTELQKEGIAIDLPEKITIDEYIPSLERMYDDLDQIEHGRPMAGKFEDFIGELLRLCFFRSLSNPQARAGELNGVTFKDWIVANVAPLGFWQMVRSHPQYRATQVVWECKNYSKLTAEDFQQTAYYMGGALGNFVIICFRGDAKHRHYYDHIQKIHQTKQGLVLLLTDQDFKVFLRQAINNKTKDSHIQDRFDYTTRLIG